ncbi:integrase core domain-containing protein [Nonomuraea sp. 3N208]|uniref:integrase core domain-containing protein n=1 Tax=Nonomuraea sp. 3N208 TaxID=3457421 RepID=UPI003FD19F16
MRGQDTADRLDIEHLGVLVDEVQECVRGGRATRRKLDAAFKISFARCSSAFSRRSRFSSADVVRPGRLPSSMGSVGDSDNAMMESFWSRMRVELLDRQRWNTRIELANAIFDLKVWHNRQRRHSSLGMLTPIQFENASTVA